MVFWQQPGGRHPVGNFNGATTSYQVGSGEERLSKTPGKQQWLSVTNTADKTAQEGSQMHHRAKAGTSHLQADHSRRAGSMPSCVV